MKISVFKFVLRRSQYQQFQAAFSTRGIAPIADMKRAEAEPETWTNAAFQERSTSPEQYDSLMDAIESELGEVQDSDYEASLPKRASVGNKTVPGSLRTRHKENEMQHMERRRSSRPGVVAATVARDIVDDLHPLHNSSDNIDNDADENKDEDRNIMIHYEPRYPAARTAQMISTARKRPRSQATETSSEDPEPAHSRRRVSASRSVELGSEKNSSAINDSPSPVADNRRGSNISITSEHKNLDQSYPSPTHTAESGAHMVAAKTSFLRNRTEENAHLPDEPVRIDTNKAVRLACRNCNSSHVKCDRKVPCSRCQNSNRG